MDHITNRELPALIGKAAAGDKDALETVILSIQDLVFNLSLRMLGTFSDAEDASQDILLKVITHLSSFRGDDILNGKIDDVPDLTQDVEQSLLAEELKMSCTNVMLQCLDPESRCIFILGTMFKLDSRIAGDILGITPEAYRQRLSRVRKKVAGFLDGYCGEYGRGKCHCASRVNYAIQNHRISPHRLDFTAAAPVPVQTMVEVKEAMEAIDELSAEFSFCKAYQSPETLKQFIRTFLAGTAMKPFNDYLNKALTGFQMPAR